MFSQTLQRRWVHPLLAGLFLPFLLVWGLKDTVGQSWLHYVWGGGVAWVSWNGASRFRGLISRISQFTRTGQYLILGFWLSLGLFVGPYTFATLIFYLGLSGVSWELSVLVTFLIFIFPLVVMGKVLSPKKNSILWIFLFIFLFCARVSKGTQGFVLAEDISEYARRNTISVPYAGPDGEFHFRRRFSGSLQAFALQDKRSKRELRERQKSIASLGRLSSTNVWEIAEDAVPLNALNSNRLLGQLRRVIKKMRPTLAPDSMVALSMSLHHWSPKAWVEGLKLMSLSFPQVGVALGPDRMVVVGGGKGAPLRSLHAAKGGLLPEQINRMLIRNKKGAQSEQAFWENLDKTKIAEDRFESIHGVRLEDPFPSNVSIFVSLLQLPVAGPLHSVSGQQVGLMEHVMATRLRAQRFRSLELPWNEFQEFRSGIQLCPECTIFKDGARQLVQNYLRKGNFEGARNYLAHLANSGWIANQEWDSLIALEVRQKNAAGLRKTLSKLSKFKPLRAAEIEWLKSEGKSR